MKKRLISVILTAAMLMTALAGCNGKENAPAGSQESPAQQETQEASQSAGGGKGTKDNPIELGMGAISQDPATTTAKYRSMGDELAILMDKVEEYSEGGVTIKGYWSGTLGGNPSMQEQVMMGELDMHFGQPMSSNDPRYGAWNLPFVYDSYDEIIAAVNPVDGPVFEVSSRWCEENGVHLVLISMSMMRSFINSKHEVRVPEDCKDLKIRTYEDDIVNTFWSGLGTASIIAGSEIYSALQTKTVDAMEFHLSGIDSYNLNEVATYVTELNWQWTNGGCLTINQEVWDSLDPSAQEAINKAALDAFLFQAEQELKDLEELPGYLTDDLGMEFITLTDAERQLWIDYARSLDATFIEKIGQEAFDEYMAAVEDAKTRVTEGTAYTLN